MLVVMQAFNFRECKVCNFYKLRLDSKTQSCLWLSYFQHWKLLNSCLVTENKFNHTQKITKDFCLVTKEVKISKSPNSLSPYTMKVECLHLLPEGNRLQASYVFKWNCVLPFLFFYFVSIFRYLLILIMLSTENWF